MIVSILTIITVFAALMLPILAVVVPIQIFCMIFGVKVGRPVRYRNNITANMNMNRSIENQMVNAQWRYDNIWRKR